ncbi:LOW QUALITY PROTEIN: hypothetical protein HID58_073871, partial [Brassica napus]
LTSETPCGDRHFPVSTVVPRTVSIVASRDAFGLKLGLLRVLRCGCVRGGYGVAYRASVLQEHDMGLSHVHYCH